MSTPALPVARSSLTAPRILRLSRAAKTPLADGLAARFDAVLCEDAAGAARAGALGLPVLVDLAIDRTEGEAPAGVFARLPRPTLDPRHEATLATQQLAVFSDPESAVVLGRFWGAKVERMAEAGVAGARLLGLQNVPGALLPTFLLALREAAPAAILFGWTPGVAWDVLAALPPGVLDWVACSLPWWDGRSDWIWREIDLLRPLGAVVADAGEGAAPGRAALAALLAAGWMTDEAGDDRVAALREVSALRERARWAGPHVTAVSAPGQALMALLATDQPDPRRAARASLAMVNGGEAASAVVAGSVLTRLGAAFGRFADAEGDVLGPLDTVTLQPGEARVWTATAAAPAAVGTQRGLVPAGARRAAERPRIALENLAPCVDGGRFPARRTVGSPVRVEVDVIGDGHERFAAAVSYRPPGASAWTEVRMEPLGNDRWAAEVPLERLGITHLRVEAWKDVWAYYVHELSAKHEAGVNTSLEIREGRAHVARAAERSSGGLRAQLEGLLAGKAGDDAARTALLSEEAARLMDLADDRPHRVEWPVVVPIQAERTAAGFAGWYEVFPRSMSDDAQRHGTFRDVVRHLPRIRAMGFDVLYFPPIHPIGRKNRKGRNNTLTPGPDDPGSPYAIGSDEGGHTDIHPELGTLEDFEHLRAEAARAGIELALDFAIQCSPDHPWLTQHPDWFIWRPDGSIRYAENPPKKYQDIVNVDFYADGAVPGLWLELARVVLFWARAGVRLFRVDNPHTKAFPFWEWMIAEVQARYPDTVFLAEAFTRPKVMYRLAKIGFSQSYTYFTWRHEKWEFQQYLTELTQGAPAEFFRPHFFVNTPDINPFFLQTSGRPGFLIRAALAATLSGLWGVYSGFELCEGTPLAPGREEYLDSEKYEIHAWDWERPGNIVAEIAALNAIRRRNPALQTHLGITFLDCPNPQILLFEKATGARDNVVLVAISLDPRGPQAGPLEVPFWRWEAEPAALASTDLLSGAEERWTERRRYQTLSPDRPYALWRLSIAQ